MLLETPDARHTPPGIALRAYTPDVLLAGGETVDVAGIGFEVLAVPGHSPAHVAYHADGCLFSGDVLFAGSVGRTDLPGADWETLARVDPQPRRHASRRDGRLSGPRTDHDARRRARGQPVPRASCARSGRREPVAEDRAPARHTRRHSLRAAALAEGDVGDRDAVRALRLPPDHDARLRGHGALRADVRRRLRRRPEGDVHVLGSLGPVAHAAARGDRADLSRLPRARDAARAAAREALHDRVDVPLRRARQGAPPRALAGVRRGGRQRRSRDRRGADPALRRPARPARRHALPPRAQLDRLPRVPPRVPRQRCARGSTSNLDRLDEATREKAATSPLRVFDNYAAKPEARACRARRGAEDRRVALRRVRRALRRRPRAPRRHRRGVPARADARARASTTTRARPGSSSARSRTRTRRSRAAAATTTSSRRSAAHRRRGSGFGAGIERLLLAMEEEGIERRRARRRSTSSSPSSRVRRASAVAGWLAELRAAGSRATRTTRAARSRASSRRPAASAPRRRSSSAAGGATIRRAGSADEAVTHDELLDRLSR